MGPFLAVFIPSLLDQMNYVSFSKFQDCIILEFDTDASAGFLKNPIENFPISAYDKYNLYFTYSFSVFFCLFYANKEWDIWNIWKY